MTINNFDDPAIHKTFLISYPLDYTMCLLFGRMTWKIRGYNLNSEKSRDWMVHIKNYWRFKGGEIYQSSRRKMFPDFTMGMICVMKYIGAIALRKDARTKFLRKKTIYKSLRNNVR